MFDIDTANLEGQTLYIPYQQTIPLDQLLADPIARPRITGFAELPLDESRKSSGPWLIPVPVGLLLHQSRCPWLDQPEALQRMADDTLDGKDCYVIRSLAQDMTSDIWIDKQTRLIQQMSLPIKLLAGEVVASDQVDDVRLIARYRNASVNQSVPGTTFDLSDDADRVPVRKFVSLPEVLPSPMIGKRAPGFTFQTRTGTVNHLHFDQQTTALIWLSGNQSANLLQEELDLLKSAAEKYEVGLVYADTERLQPGTDNISPFPSIERLSQASGWPTYYDQRLTAGAKFEFSSLPVAVVLDGDAVVHYVRAISPDDRNWAQELVAAMQRVDQGENVAAEMNLAYSQYLDTYQQQLAAVDASALLPGFSSQAAKRPTDSRPGQWSIQPQQAWICRDFKQPGNLTSLHDSSGQVSMVAAFDGWQTVAMVNAEGQRIDNQTLPLETNEAAVWLRASRVNGWKATLAPLGRRVRIYDDNFQLQGTLKVEELKSHDSDESFTWAQYSDLDRDNSPELIVSTGNAAEDANPGRVLLVDPATLHVLPISDNAATAVTGFNGDVVALQSGRLVRLKSGREISTKAETSEATSEVYFRHLTSLNDRQLVASGKSASGRWSAVGWDQQLNRKWTVEIGPQLFDQAIEPIAGIELSLGSESETLIVWAIADSENHVQLVTGEGAWLGQFESDSPIHGLTLIAAEDRPALLVANQNGVECWSLNLSRSR